MSSVTRVLTWAVPVDYDKLAPHLNAYEALKPIAYPFRLCNRFGRGDAVHVNKLPQELVDNIVDLVVQDEIEKYTYD